MGDIHHPLLIGTVRRELSLFLILRTRHRRIGMRCAYSPAPDGTTQASGPHQTFHCAARHPDALPVERTPGLVGPINAEVALPGPFDIGNQLRITSRTSTQQGGIELEFRVRPVHRWGNLQHLADRLKPEISPMLVDERLHDFGRRSSPAWVKKALARRRIFWLASVHEPRAPAP